VDWSISILYLLRKKRLCYSYIIRGQLLLSPFINVLDRHTSDMVNEVRSSYMLDDILMFCQLTNRLTNWAIDNK